MTIKHKSNMSFDHAYLAKLESGKEPLPVGVHRTSNGKAYRIARTFKGKDFRFGTFQSLEHALRTNEYINRFMVAVDEELNKKPATDEDVRVTASHLATMISSQNDMLEKHIERVKEQVLDVRIEMLEDKVVKQNAKKSLFQRIFKL